MQGNEGHRASADSPQLTPGERELELALGSLRPPDPGVDRARALFDAGIAVGRRKARAWQGAAGMMVVALTVSLLRGPAGRTGSDGTPVAPRAIVTASEKPLPAHPAAAPDTTFVLSVVLATRGSTNADENVLPPLPLPGERPRYLQLRDQVLQQGPEALRPPDAAAPIWMADPAARRVLGPSRILKS